MGVTTEPEAAWPVTWEASRRAMFRDLARSTIEQRLQWLEGAIELARGSGALARGCARRDAEALRIWERGNG